MLILSIPQELSWESQWKLQYLLNARTLSFSTNLLEKKMEKEGCRLTTKSKNNIPSVDTETAADGVKLAELFSAILFLTNSPIKGIVFFFKFCW